MGVIGNLFLTIECQLIKIEGRKELERCMDANTTR